MRRKDVTYLHNNNHINKFSHMILHFFVRVFASNKSINKRQDRYHLYISKFLKYINDSDVCRNIIFQLGLSR